MPEQTDSSPYNTSTGERVHSHGVAISRDLLCGACKKLHHRCKHPEYEVKVHYGDWLFIENIGIKVVNDCLAPATIVSRTRSYRIEKQIDVWVPNYSGEQNIDKLYGKKRLKAWKIKEELCETKS